MNEISCIFCGIKSGHNVIEENGYKGKKCPQCGLIYISPRPSLGEIFDLYGHDDAHTSAESHISADFSKRLYAKHHLKIIRSVIKSGSILEVGAGAGHFLDEARKIGFTPYALEFNPVQANYIRNKLSIPCEESPLDTSIFEEKKFDVVYHRDVISHFFDPISEFKMMNKVMKDESYLIFETGNIGEIEQKYFKYFKKFQYPDHLFFFSPDNLVTLLDKTGFEYIKIYRYSILPELITTKALSGIKKAIKKYVFKTEEIENCSPDKVDVELPSGTKLFAQEFIKNSYQYFNYVLFYKIGRIAQKARRPQTIIVVAKKSR